MITPTEQISPKNRFVIYQRVSTQRQGVSGLGLEAQRKAVEAYVKDREIIGEYIEIETGTNKRNRPEIQRAIEHCKKHNATLLIAKLDRLSRNVAFIANLMDSNIDFVAVDMPQANKLTIHILSAIAEHEAKLISERTRSSLAIAKQRGKRLGNPQNLTQEARLKGAQRRKELAMMNENNVKATTVICLLREQSKMSYGQIADKLNRDGFKTSRGKAHTAWSVQLLYKRARNLVS